jgi:hypothetical protein
VSHTLDFVVSEHRYYLDGERELPSVTTILKEQGLINADWFTEEARLRGDYVHLACRMVDDDELDDATLDPKILPYVDAYRKFLAVTQPDWTYVEHRVFDEVLGYAGTLDRAGMVQGTKYLIDIKSGTVPSSVGPQTAAYRRCLPEPHTWKRAALQLKADGSFALHNLTDRSDERIFLAALELTIWRKAYVR